MKALEATHAELMAAQQAEMAASGQLRLQLAEMEHQARDHHSAEVALKDSLEAAAEDQKQHMNMVRTHAMLGMGTHGAHDAASSHAAHRAHGVHSRYAAYHAVISESLQEGCAGSQVEVEVTQTCCTCCHHVQLLTGVLRLGP